MAKRTLRLSEKRGNGEYDARFEAILNGMNAHVEADAVAFRAMNENLVEMNKDLKVIIGARHFASGVWKALTLSAGALVALVTLFLMYLGTR